jgi:abequosyltransferase
LDKAQPTATPVRPLLTIAIPTFNRCQLLKQLLDSLLVQIPDDGTVELFVSDNACTDETPAVVEEYRKKYPRLQHIRNQTNVGPDGNFLQCYERAAGKYVWIFSDDDLLCPGALRGILGHLAREEYDLVYLCSSGFVDSPRCRPVAAVPRALVFTAASRFIRMVHIFTTLISCNIINKERVETIEHEPFSNLINSSLIQLGWTFAALRCHRKSLYITEELVCYRLGNTGGYGVCRVFGPTLKGVTEEWLGIPRLNDLIVNASLQRLIPPCLFAANRNRHGNYLRENPHEVMREDFSGSLRYWIFDYPLIVLPTSLASIWFLLLRIFNRVDRAFGYPSLSW